MSGRSAYVRKKITQTKADEAGVARGRARSNASSDDNATIVDPALPARQNTGIGTTNVHFLKFAEPIHEVEPADAYYHHGSGSQSGGSTDGRHVGRRGPLQDHAYARARRPNIRTEDMSGIEKSGLRSAVDKKSEDVRRGLAKAFGFGKKSKSDDKGPDPRPPSAATVRAPLDHEYGSPVSPTGMGFPPDSLDAMTSPRLGQQQQQQQQQPFLPPINDQPWELPGSARFPPPSSKLPPIPVVTTPQIKRWVGAGRPVQRWNKLRKDPELWDPNGDVLVYFGHRGQQPRPNPSFRLSSHIIEATESRFLITQLREGSTEEDMQQLPPSPVGTSPMMQRHLAGGGGSGGSGGGGSSQHLSPHGYGANGQPTPPISEDNSLHDADGQISYEMYFPTPANLSKTEQLRSHITTRNVFALLYHASLVGLSLYQALADLHARLEAYMPPDTDNVGTVINYLAARGIDDVRNEPEAAVSLLAWSESPDVRWEEGWRESFLHCVGMYARLEACADFRSVTPITRALLERASLETQLRVQAAEERLDEFQYTDMWPAAAGAGPAKAAANRLQKFLIAHYTRAYGRWPPLPLATSAVGPVDQDDDMWLTRTVAQELQRDFGALYDYLVDRDIVWDGSEARSGRKWMLVSESGNRAFEADTQDLPMTDMLVEFDNRLRFPHIPHPYPLVPESVPVPIPVTPAGDNGRSNGRKDKKAAAQPAGTGSTATTGRANAMERRVQLAYTVATNMLVLGSDFTQSDLIDAFSKFEKADRVGEVDPSTARRGRWVLVYGVLQTLASVAVDALNVRYRDGVAYHISPRLKGAKMPPWRTATGGGLIGTNDESAHELSHCWLVPRTWNIGQGVSHGGLEGSMASSFGGSGNTSPVYSTAGGGGGFSFPRPPPTEGGMSHLSVARNSFVGQAGYVGYHTPLGARSVRSSVSVAAVGGHGAGGPHGMGMGIGIAHSYSHGHSGYTSPAPPVPYLGSFGVYTPSSAGSIGGGSSVLSSDHSSTRRRRAATAPYSGQQSTETASQMSASAVSDFLSLDDGLSGSDGEQQRTAGPARRSDRPLLSCDTDEADSVAPVIRDFDDMSVANGK